MIIALVMVLALVSVVTISASADSASDYVKVTKHDSYNKDGKFYMCFTIKDLSDSPLIVWAKVFDSAGKGVFNWNSKEFKPSESARRNYGADYNSLPTGKYTFKLYCSLGYGGRGWNWTYTINHTRKESFSFKSYEKVNDNGKIMHKWNIQCTNLKGHKLTMKIYNPGGKLVYNSTGPKRKTHNEVGWFSWSGYNTVGKRYKCNSGTYLVQLTVLGSNKVIEKKYKLNIT
jgi:hypothetical protein